MMSMSKKIQVLALGLILSLSWGCGAEMKPDPDTVGKSDSINGEHPSPGLPSNSETYTGQGSFPDPVKAMACRTEGLNTDSDPYRVYVAWDGASVVVEPTDGPDATQLIHFNVVRDETTTYGPFPYSKTFFIDYDPGDIAHFYQVYAENMWGKKSLAWPEVIIPQFYDPDPTVNKSLYAVLCVYDAATGQLEFYDSSLGADWTDTAVTDITDPLTWWAR